MKLHVITNDQGKVLGTYNSGPATAGAPIFNGFKAAEGQKAHEIEVSDHFSTLNAEELHKAVEKHLK